jgi:hypothetical protein
LIENDNGNINSLEGKIMRVDARIDKYKAGSRFVYAGSIKNVMKPIKEISL